MIKPEKTYQHSQCLKVRGLPALKKFRCIAEKCPDSCCHGWSVNIDHKTYDRLVKAMDINPISRRRFMAGVTPTSQPNERNFARLNTDNTGRCSFLDPDQLCHIIKNHDQSCLPDVCQFYPRVINQVDGYIEISATLSCPEMARLTLIDDEHIEFQEFDPGYQPVTNLPTSNVLQTHDASHYHRLMPLVRDVLHNIFNLSQYPINIRLYVASLFASQLSQSYRYESDVIDVQDIDEIIAFLAQEKNLNELFEMYNEQSIDSSLILSLVVSILKIRLQQGDTSAFALKSKNVLDDYGLDSMSDDLQQPMTSLIDQYDINKGLLNKTQLVRLDQYLGRYCINHLYREWYTGFPDLQSYIHLLSVRHAIIRFMIISDYALQPDRLLSDLVVENVYQFSKSIDQDADFLRIIYDALEEQQLFNFEFAPHLNCL